MLAKIEKVINKIIHYLGVFCTWLMILLLINVFYNVIMRYFFSTSPNSLQELEWHLFSVVFLFGVAYTLKEDGHVRVDILYEKLNPRKQAVINIIGVIAFILPFSLFVLYGSWSYALSSYLEHESSSNAGGLGYRFIIKSSIGISFIFLIVSAIGFILRNINTLLSKSQKDYEEQKVL